MTNDWNEREVKRAENTWGNKFPDYTIDMFDFATRPRENNVKSWLDLGCGFGRFLKFLDNNVEEPDYIGYDSSQAMVDRISRKFPAYSPRIFLHNITDPIVNPQDCIVCSAVLIHIPLEDQDKVLNNIKEANPRFLTFDINTPAESELKGRDHFYKFIGGCCGKFRMTWQSQAVMTYKILKLFPRYKLTMGFYKVHRARHKVVYNLKRHVQ